MSKEKEVLVDIQWLIRWYPGSPTFIFNKFDFKLHKNDFCFVMWKSWIWKTTLVKFLMRQLTPPKKMIYYKQEDIARFQDHEIQKYRRKIWVIYQDFKLIERKTVKQNIVYPLEILWESQETINRRLNEVLYKMDLMDKKDSLIPTLSWWEKQRVGIARALITNPEFIIADEPTGNLDLTTAKKIADLLIDINKSWKTIIFITHDITLLEYVKDKYNIKLIEMN